MTAPFADRALAAVRRVGNPICLGLDPHLDRIPGAFGERARDRSLPRAERARAVGDFLVEVVEIAAGRVPCVKPQSAFFEVLGADGVSQLERVTGAARGAGLLVIADVKRGDIGSTAAAYAAAHLAGADGDPHLADAATVNPYLGTDSIQPFVDACGASGGGLYVLVRTSNPSSAEFQTLETPAASAPTVADAVADAVAGWGADLVGDSGWSSIGAVVGATHPDELARLRARMPNVPFLLPGYGAQGAGAADVAPAFVRGHEGALVNSSRGLLFPPRADGDDDWRSAVSRAIDTMAEDLAGALAR
ncbi:MAG: orotidine-5'-phosphate decarboxylase [Planctomycetota bacterium]